MKLNKFEQRLLLIAFDVMAKDMTYDQEEEILSRLKASVEDLYELEQKIHNILDEKPEI